MITESKDPYLDIYGTAFGKMNSDHPFTYTTQGRTVTQGLSMLADDPKCHLTPRVMALKRPSDRKGVRNMLTDQLVPVVTKELVLTPCCHQQHSSILSHMY